MTLSYFLRLLDEHELSVESKGGFVKLIADIFIFTSNIEPTEWFAPEVAKGAPIESFLRRIDVMLRFINLNDVLIYEGMVCTFICCVFIIINNRLQLDYCLSNRQSKSHQVVTRPIKICWSNLDTYIFQWKYFLHSKMVCEYSSAISH